MGRRNRAKGTALSLLGLPNDLWRRLDGRNQLPKLILGVKFVDGLEVVAKPANPQSTIAAA